MRIFVDSIAGGSCRLAFSALYVYLLVALGCMSGPFVLAQLAPGEPQSRLAKLKQAFAVAEKALGEIPRERIDVNVLQQTLGDDPATLFAWVRDHTRWLPYRGVLRGPRATLLDRSGSHADRALLLTALLESAGLETRLIVGQVPKDSLVADWKLIQTHTPKADAEIDLAAVQQQLGQDMQKIAAWTGEDPEELLQQVMDAKAEGQLRTEALVERVLVQSESLQTLLPWDGSATKTELTQRTSEALSDLWWVQAKIGDQWVDMDPSLPTNEMGNARVGNASVEELDALMKDAAHTVSITIHAQVRMRDSVKTVEILTEEILSSDALGTPVLLQIQPMNWDASAVVEQDPEKQAGALREQLLKQDEWWPTLRVGSKLIRGPSIRVDGSLNETPGGENAANNALVAGVDALNFGEGKKRTANQLVGMTLTCTVASPGKPEQEFKRVLMRVDAKRSEAWTDEEKLERSAEMMSGMQLLVQSSWIPQEYALGRSLAGLVGNQKALIKVAEAATKGDGGAAHKAASKIQPEVSGLLALAHARYGSSPVREAVAITEANILGYSLRGAFREGKYAFSQGYDIVHNAVDPLPSVATSAKELRFLQGIVDTVVEGMIDPRGASPFNAASAYAEALEKGEAWSLVKSAEELPAGLPKDVRGTLESQLNAGNWLVMAREADVRSAWTIHGETGQTLGIDIYGRGSSGMEYIGNMSLALTGVGLLACVPQGGSSSNNTACCLFIWGIGFGGELGIDAYIGFANPAGAGVALACAMFFSLVTTDWC